MSNTPRDENEEMTIIRNEMPQRQAEVMASSSKASFVSIDAHHVAILRDKRHRAIALKVSLVNLFGEVEECVLPLKMKPRWLRRHERELAAERDLA